MQIQMHVAVALAADVREQEAATGPMHGAGTDFMPETSDDVVVAFAHGDLRSPYVTGSLWNDRDTPPPGRPEDESGPRHRVAR
ncbi:MAG TPA: phage baseplate assembly protein V [Burkholderiaceae bacterium]|nr:phage baseplate assembly protein V [Burkholderiaceae bacterium]